MSDIEAKGQVKYGFLHLTAHIPRRPVRMVNTPPKRLNSAKMFLLIFHPSKFGKNLPVLEYILGLP
jgi:hypothetical protein